MANRISVSVPLEMLNGGKKDFILVDKTPFFSYEGGKRSSEKPIGFKLTVVLPGNRLSQVDVRIEGDDPLPQITSEALYELTTKLDFVFVKLVDSIAKVYNIKGDQKIFASAKSAVLADEYVEFQ